MHDYLSKKVWDALDRYTERYEIFSKKWSTTDYNVNVTFSRCKVQYSWGIEKEVVATVKFNGEIMAYCYMDDEMSWCGTMVKHKYHI